MRGTSPGSCALHALTYTQLLFTESLKAYEKAVDLQRRKVRQAAARGGVSVAGVAEVIQTRVPAKLLNNAAVLYMRVGRPLKALELLEEALEVRFDGFSSWCACCIVQCDAVL